MAETRMDHHHANQAKCVAEFQQQCFNSQVVKLFKLVRKSMSTFNLEEPNC